IDADLVKGPPLAGLLGRDVHLVVDDELIPVHVGTVDLYAVDLVVLGPPLALAADRAFALHLVHLARHRLDADHFLVPILLASLVETPLLAERHEIVRNVLGVHRHLHRSMDEGAAEDTTVVRGWHARRGPRIGLLAGADPDEHLARDDGGAVAQAHHLALD